MSLFYGDKCYNYTLYLNTLYALSQIYFSQVVPYSNEYQIKYEDRYNVAKLSYIVSASPTIISYLTKLNNPLSFHGNSCHLIYIQI